MRRSSVEPRRHGGLLGLLAALGTCAGCHAKDFKPAAHPKTVKGQSYTVTELANCSGACHVYSDSTQSTITRSLPGPYHRVTDAAFKH